MEVDVASSTSMIGGIERIRHKGSAIHRTIPIISTASWTMMNYKDIICSILQFLNLKELHTAQQVCHYWRRVLHSMKSVSVPYEWPGVAVPASQITGSLLARHVGILRSTLTRPYGMNTFVDLIAAFPTLVEFAHRRTCIRDPLDNPLTPLTSCLPLKPTLFPISVTRLHIWICPTYAQSFMDDALIHLKQLIQLNLVITTDHSDKSSDYQAAVSRKASTGVNFSALRYLTNLEQFDLHTARWGEGAINQGRAILFDALTHMPNLRRFQAPDYWYLNDEESLKALFASSTPFGALESFPLNLPLSDTVLYSLSLLPALTEIRFVSFAPNFTDLSLLNQSEFSRLQSLAFQWPNDGSPLLDIAHVVTCVSSLTGLLSLDLSHPMLDHVHLTTICQNLQQLQELHLFCCNGVASLSFVEAVAPTLKELWLSYCETIEPSSLSSLRKLKSLQLLEINHCFSRPLSMNQFESIHPHAPGFRLSRTATTLSFTYQYDEREMRVFICEDDTKNKWNGHQMMYEGVLDKITKQGRPELQPVDSEPPIVPSVTEAEAEQLECVRDLFGGF